MKKTFSLFLFSTIYCFILSAQDCRPSKFYVKFQPNNVNTTLSGSGDLISLYEGYRVSNTDCNYADFPSTLFASTIWMGGITSDGVTRIAATGYRSLSDDYDWYPGPLDENGETYDTNCDNWDKTFEINGNDIKKLITNYNNTVFIGVDCNKLPLSVKYWPAKGNPYWKEKYKFDLPNQDLASFYDYDKDGLYDPCKGDLPSLNFVTDKDIDKTPEKIISTFPSQLLFWIINDNGGPHRYTPGDPIKMELHFYAYGYKGEKDIDNTSFFHIRTLYKGDLDLEEVFMGLWVDPDLGCYTDDYVGTDTLHDMMYVYNEDAQDGLNGIECPGGIKSFGEKVPIMGMQFVEGLKDLSSNNIKEFGLTSTMYMNNAAVGNSDPVTTDPEGIDRQFYNVMRGVWRTGDVVTYGGSGYNPASTDSTKFIFSDPPDDPNGWSMCTAGLGFGDRRVLMSTGGNIKMKNGDVNDVVIAFIYQPISDLPCPSIKPLQNVASKVKNFHDNQYKLTIGPDAPEVTNTAKNNTIVLKLNNDFPGSNNKDLSYTSKVEGIDSYYKFEGYKVYQHSADCFSSNVYDGSGFSKLIFQYDLQNNVTDIYNWEEDGFTINKVLKVTGSNSGVPQNITIDYDYLNDEPLINGKEYYYEVIAYGHNNYLDYDSITDQGQKQAYIEGTGNRNIYKITPLLKNENEHLGVQIIRLKGEGVSRYNTLQPTYDDFTFDINSSEISDTIEYLQEKGPFTVSIIDESKVDTNIVYKINFKGDFDVTPKVCDYIDATLTYEVVNDETGEILIPETLVNGKNDILLDEIGLMLNIYFKDDPNLFIDQTENFNFKYKEENGVKWFSSLIKNDIELKSQEEQILDPVQHNDFLERNYQHKLNYFPFFPFVNSKFYVDDVSEVYISPTNKDAHAIATDRNSGTLKIDDLNNVQLVFTSDKSKWSRCIVVEGASDFYTKGGLFTTLDGAKQMETRITPSVGKDGKPDNSGTTGFSWFPGYAYDIEKGERLNVFFAENTCLRNIPGYEKISTDMIFNPTDVTIDTTINDLRKYLVGGQHFIYVTRQKYDECKDLSLRLARNSSNFNKRFPYGVITWTSVPVLSNGTNFVSIEDGLIPNDLSVSLRVTNTFSKEKYVVEATKVNNCITEDEDPSYLLKIGKKSIVNNVKNISDNSDFIKFKSGINSFSISNLRENSVIEIFNLNGVKIKSYKSNNSVFSWKAEDSINRGMYIVNVKSTSGTRTSGKVIVVR